METEVNWPVHVVNLSQNRLSRYWYSVASVFLCVCLSVCRLSSSVTLCIVAKRCFLEQKLLLRAYRKSYMGNRLVQKINDLDLRLEVVSRSRQPLRYI